MQYALRHEAALAFLGGGREEAREVRAPGLDAFCGRDPDHPEAEKVLRVSRAELLRCAVCGTRLAKKFGRIDARHFAQRPEERRCVHEAETVEHREAKRWRVEAERSLTDSRRRPDVLPIAPRAVSSSHSRFSTRICRRMSGGSGLVPEPGAGEL